MPTPHLATRAARAARVTVAALLVAALAPAAWSAQPYAGASLGRSDYRIDTTGAASADTRDTAGKVFAGLEFTPHLGAELAAFDLGRARGRVELPGGTAVDASARVRGLGLWGVARAPLGPVSVFGKAGLTTVRARLTTTVDTELPGAESSWQPALGVGLQFDLDRRFAVRGEWERLRVRFPGGEKDDVDLLSVGMLMRF